MAHGFGAAPEGPLGAVARRLSGEGIAAFAFDYRNFGASAGEPRQLLDLGRQLEDWRAAIAYARQRPDVDPDRVGLWGSSLSGGQVLTIAARDREIAAVVAQVPYVDGLSVLRAAGVRHNLRLLPSFARDQLRKVRGRPPYLINAVGPPGAVAGISTKYADLYTGLTRAAPGWRNELAARSVLQIYRYRPAREAREISCPLLVVLSYHDRVAPPGPAVRAAQGLPYVELLLVPARHFDLYISNVRERALHTEVQFFVHKLDGDRDLASSDVVPRRVAQSAAAGASSDGSALADRSRIGP